MGGDGGGDGGEARDAWRLLAACRDVHPSVFFALEVEPGANMPGAGRANAVRTAAAKEYCRGCPVQTECLTFALRTRQQYGVWGGLSESERGRRRARLAR